MEIRRSFLPEFAFNKLYHIIKEGGLQSDKSLQTLHSLFGENFTLATELLEKCSITEYNTANGMRSVYKIITNKEQFTIFQDINFCCCELFKSHVLELRSSLTCKHVLAVQLSSATGQVKQETVSDSQFVDFLNEQMNSVEDNVREQS